MPTQMPSTGRPPASRRSITWSPRTARSPAMQAANAPTPGTTSPSASIAALASAVTSVSAPARCRARSRRTDVARAVVQHRDRGRGLPRTHRVPLVLGTPDDRGSGATAARSARATALNWASTMWCGLRPVTSRCRQMPAVAVTDSKKCRVSVVS